MKVELIWKYVLLVGVGGGIFLTTVVGALECYTCDSAEDTECATRPGQQISVEDCAKSDDECVTVIAAGHTRRGCLSRLFPNKYCAEPCDRCATNLCNRHIFPADRLRCYQCVGADCINVEGKHALLLPCPIYKEVDRCYTNVIGLSNVQRGCEQTNLPPTCPHVCLKCNTDGCNTELGVFEQSCLQCSHSTASPNPACWRSQVLTPAGKRCAVAGIKTCTNKLMHGHSAKCFTYVNEQTGVMQRGCSTTMGFFPTGTLRECSGKNCNDECIAISCNNCTTASSDGGSCRQGNNLRPQKCADNAIACYSCEEGVHLRRGCVDNSYQPGSSEACYQCRHADGCNRQPVRTCYHCSSMSDDEESAANCAYSLIKSRLGQRNCSAPNELCVSTVVGKLNLQYMLRGCASQVPECSASDPLCVRCNGSLCNSEPIPWNAMENVFSKSRQLRTYQLPGKSRNQTRSGVDSNVLAIRLLCVVVGSIHLIVKISPIEIFLSV